jgi:dethiobiotin synthetase
MVVVVTGTGTGIGKTHFCEALLLMAAREGLRAAGVKPIESGVASVDRSDADRLRAASTFHVKPFGLAFPDSMSPHLAARLAGLPIQIDPIVATVDELRTAPDLLVIELPGGLFTPLAPPVLNVDLATALRPDVVLLVAPDRLGALHDVIVTVRAARAHPLVIDGVVLVTPREPDASTGRNAADIPSLTNGVAVAAELPWAPAPSIAADGTLRQYLFRRLRSARPT